MKKNQMICNSHIFQMQTKVGKQRKLTTVFTRIRKAFQRRSFKYCRIMQDTQNGPN